MFPTPSHHSANPAPADAYESPPASGLTIPEDSEEIKATARSLARAGRFDEAIRFWHAIEERDPFDPEPGRMIPALTLKKNRQIDTKNGDDKATGKGGPVAASASAAPPQSPDASPPPAKQPRTLVLTRRQQLEQEIAFHPQEEKNYLELAELHLAERRTYDAQRTLMKALEVSRDVAIVERLEDVNMLRAREQWKLAETLAAEQRSEETTAAVDKARQDCFQLELDVHRNRCVRHPDDKRLKYHLGMKLKQIGEYREALERLQAGLEFPDLRAAASLEIGEILQRHHQFPKALQCYRQAAQLAAGDDGLELQECRKRALYRAGVLATSMTLIDSARQYLAELVKMDPGYRDAQTRLDKLGEISDTF